MPKGLIRQPGVPDFGDDVVPSGALLCVVELADLPREIAEGRGLGAAWVWVDCRDPHDGVVLRLACDFRVDAVCRPWAVAAALDAICGDDVGFRREVQELVERTVAALELQTMDCVTTGGAAAARC